MSQNKSHYECKLCERPIDAYGHLRSHVASDHKIPWHHYLEYPAERLQVAYGEYPNDAGSD